MTIQICAFNHKGQGIDAITETTVFYDSPAAGRAAASAILAKYGEIAAVWVRKINNGHMRTITMVRR